MLIRADVRFGQKQTCAACLVDVRFTPKSGHSSPWCELGHAVLICPGLSLAVRHRRAVLCSSGPNSITTAKSSAGLQRRSRSSPWRRLFWRQLPLTFCANHLELSATILMSALPPKADMCGATRDVRFVPIVDICKMDRGCVPTSGAALQLPRRRSLGSGRANPTATKRSSPPPMRALTTVSTRMSPSR